MAEVGPVTLVLKTSGMEDANASFTSLACVFGPSGPQSDVEKLLVEFLLSRIDGGDDAPDLIRSEFFGNLTSRAIELHSLKILPSDRYVELVSAVADEREDLLISFRHGWPILSLAGDTASMAELPGSGNCARQGGRA